MKRTLLPCFQRFADLREPRCRKARRGNGALLGGGRFPDLRCSGRSITSHDTNGRLKARRRPVERVLADYNETDFSPDVGT